LQSLTRQDKATGRNWLSVAYSRQGIREALSRAGSIQRGVWTLQLVLQDENDNSQIQKGIKRKTNHTIATINRLEEIGFQWQVASMTGDLRSAVAS